jgi:hypothetical protein
MFAVYEASILSGGLSHINASALLLWLICIK